MAAVFDTRGAIVQDSDTVTKAYLREAQLRKAAGAVDVAEERRAVGRLAGQEDLYQSIKTLEATPHSSRPFAGEYELRAKRRKAVNEALRRGKFDSVAQFDDAVRDLRRVVMRHGVSLTLQTLAESEKVLTAELACYFSREECNRLATELKAFRRLPGRSRDP